MAKSSQRNRLLDRFHNVMKLKSLADIKADKQLLQALYDQYRRAMTVLSDQKNLEDQAIERLKNG